MSRFDPALLEVQRRAREDIRALPVPPAHLDAPRSRLRALLIEVLERLARNPDPDRWPDCGPLLDDIAQVSAQIGIGAVPLRIRVEENPEARVGVAHPTDGDPYLTTILEYAQPGCDGQGGMVVERYYKTATEGPLWHDLPLGRVPDYLRSLVELLLRWVRHLDLAPLEPPPRVLPSSITNGGFDDESYMTSVQVAVRLGSRHDPVRKRLDRWRAANGGADWHEVANAKSKEPRYLYRIRAIRPILNDLIASRPSDRDPTVT